MKQTKWNLAKEGGWMRYKEETLKYSKALEKIVEDEDVSIDEKYDKFKKIHDKIKFRAFGKVTIGPGKELKRQDRSEEEDSSEKLLEAQQRKAEAEICAIEKVKGGKVGKVWEIKKKVIGTGKTASCTS